jgi:2-polyprenyl-3-methyl-5-hydroxy-6-metoxy-1,4-benzoquinol methylase
VEQDRSFDVVTMWCVVAHVPDPRALLSDAVRALRPGGVLLLTTPNLRFQMGYAAALGALGRPLDFESHDHLLHFTPSAIRRLLADVGLRAHRFTYVGITEDCVASRRLAPLLVPAKRVWNRAAVIASRAGAPLVSSELQVLARAG